MIEAMSDDGFSLVELMVVVAVISALAAVGLPIYSKFVKRSKTSEADEHLEKLKNGAVNYYLSDQKYSTPEGSEPWHPAGSGDKRPGMPVPSDARVFPGYDGSTMEVRTHKDIPKGKAKPDYESRVGATGKAVLKTLNFAVQEPTSFVYMYRANKESFDVYACHDYEGSGTISGEECKKDSVEAHQVSAGCKIVDGKPKCRGTVVRHEFE